MDDPYNLARFVTAQNDNGRYDQALSQFDEALSQLLRGRKTSHWMWFIFPQFAGLGQSSRSRHFAIASIDEARAYVEHAVLGPRLLACAAALASDDSPTAEEIFCGIDTQKLRSSLTLFMQAVPDQPIFAQLLDRHFSGATDSVTEELIKSH